MQERRKCRKFIPWVYFWLQVIGVLEGVLLVMYINADFLILSIVLALVGFTIFADKTTQIINSRCPRKVE